MYDDITLETVALDTPNNVAIFVKDIPAERTRTTKIVSLPYSYSFTRFSLNSIINALTGALQM
jgi:hypothetical protein